MATLSPSPILKFYAADGTTPLAAGKVYTYQSGSTTPQPTYTNASGTLAANPVVLDSKGEAVMYLDTASNYRFDIKTTGDVLVRRVDDIQAAPTSIATSNIQAGAVGTTQLANDSVTFAKIQNLSGQSLIGKSTAGSGDSEQIGLSSDFSFTGATLQLTTTERVNALTITAGAITIDLSLGNYFTLSLTSNITSITFTNAPASGRAESICLEISQDVTGGRTIAGWPAAVTWSGGAYTPTSTASASDLVTLSTLTQGTKYRGTYLKNFV